MTVTTAGLRDLDLVALRAPWDLYDAWREAGAVLELPELGGWVITDPAVATAVMRDGETWSTDAFEGPVDARREQWLRELAAELPDLDALLSTPLAALLAVDPPDHGRLRNAMTPFFSAANVRRLAPLVDDLVQEALPALVTGEPVDAVSAFAQQLPLHVIATLLGLPRDTWPRFGALAAAASTSNPHREGRAALRARLEAELELMRFFAASIDAPPAGRDVHGVLEGLHDATADGRLTAREAAGLCRELLVAGAESTVHHLSAALLLLALDPALIDRLRAEPDLVPAFTEEALRLEPPFPGFWRRARAAVELAGVRLPQDALVLLPFAALNRDPALFPDPAVVKLDRPNARRHLAFGHGIHFCLGAPLVRLQSHAVLRALLPRARRIELLVDPDALEPIPSIQDRGVRALPVRCVPA